MTNFIFQSFSKDSLLELFSTREGETKIGEKIAFQNANSKTKYVLLGIEECAGPQANFGQTGAQNGFKAFLKRFLNMQSNRFLSGEEILLLGAIKQTSSFYSQKETSTVISELDTLVEEIVKPYVIKGYIPIVIGGGHNNAYPIIKAISESFNQAIHVFNLDPHADCRALEGRHSGNSFSYAKEHGFMDQYTVFGLHKNYNSEFIYNYLEKNNFNFTFFEDYILNDTQFDVDIQNALLAISENCKFGIELDLDAIEFTPSSAYTPSGINSVAARKYIKTFAKHKNCVYLHLPEGAPNNELEEKIVGKLLAYFVADFIQENTKI